MTPDAHESPPQQRPGPLWRVATPVVFMLSGALFVVSAISSEGTDLRPGRYADLASLVAHESREATSLQERANRLAEENNRLATSFGDAEIQQYVERAEALEDPAGLTTVSGPGITVTLKDSPESVRETSNQKINLLVVHQQDIQQVVNAMWRAGARAITLQGKRIITTTGIKCSGPVVRLHGIPYAQPYVINAVGDPEALEAAIDADDYLDLYREQAQQPDIQIGWEMTQADHLVAEPYDGPTVLSYAEPAEPVEAAAE